TPEYHALPWPADARVIAVDRSVAMLQAVWPGSERVHADWRALPLADTAVDLVLCDGGLVLQAWPRAQQALVLSLQRDIRPGGLLSLRCFVPPAVRESLADIRADLQTGRHTNPNLLRLRQWLALQQSPAAGVDNRAAWAALAALGPRLDELAARLQVDSAYLRVAVAEADDRTFHFIDLAAIRELFCNSPGGFRLEQLHVGDYPFAELCPRCVLRRL